MERDKYFSADEAIKFGLIDKIIENRKNDKENDKDSLFCSFCGKNQKKLKN